MSVIPVPGSDRKLKMRRRRRKTSMRATMMR